MSSRKFLNALLLVMAVVLLLVAYFQPGIEGEKALPKLTPLDTASVKRITLIYPDGREVVLEKRHGTWYLAKPLEVEANRFRAESLLFLTQEGVRASYSPKALPLAKVGLEKPLLRIRFDDFEVAFGETEPLEGNRYALVDGRVVLIRDRIAPLLSADITYFVSHALLPEGSSIVAMKLPLLRDNPSPDAPFGKTVEIKREGHGWKIVSEKDISQAAIERLVEGWRYAHALEVETLKGDEKPIAEVSIQLAGKERPLRFWVLSVMPEPWLARPDLKLKYHLTQELFRRLFRFKKEDAGTP